MKKRGWQPASRRLAAHQNGRVIAARSEVLKGARAVSQVGLLRVKVRFDNLRGGFVQDFQLQARY